MGKRLTCALCHTPTPPPSLHTVYVYGTEKPIKTTTLRVCGGCFRDALKVESETLEVAKAAA